MGSKRERKNGCEDLIEASNPVRTRQLIALH